jgi:hypothetical protein
LQITVKNILETQEIHTAQDFFSIFYKRNFQNKSSSNAKQAAFESVQEKQRKTISMDKRSTQIKSVIMLIVDQKSVIICKEKRRNPILKTEEKAVKEFKLNLNTK